MYARESRDIRSEATMNAEHWELSKDDYKLTEQLKQARVKKILDDSEVSTSSWCQCIVEVMAQRMCSSKEDIRNPQLWRGAGAECLGTGLMVLIGCGAWISGDQPPSVVQVSMAFGIAVSTIMWTLGHLSGGHINPAVSFAMVVSRRISLAKAIVYSLAQCLGALVGAGILYGLTPATIRGTLGATLPHPDITAAQSFTIEALLTFVWVLTLFATSDVNRSDLSRGAPLATGLAVVLCHLYAVRLTGASMNPARSFGPAVVANEWKGHWVYWFGPPLGAALAALLYDNALAVNSSLDKARAYLMAGDYEPDRSVAAHMALHSPGPTSIRTTIDNDIDNDTAKCSVAESKSMDEFSVKNDKLRVTEMEFSL